MMSSKFVKFKVCKVPMSELSTCNFDLLTRKIGDFS